MVTAVDFSRKFGCWLQDKWTGQFGVRWHFIKDVPNAELRHITLENNEHKPVTNSRDTQEVPYRQGCEILAIFLHYRQRTSLLDDFEACLELLSRSHACLQLL